MHAHATLTHSRDRNYRETTIREPDLSFDRSINRSAENDSPIESVANKLKSRRIDIRYLIFTMDTTHRFSIYRASCFIFVCLTYDNYELESR